MHGQELIIEQMVVAHRLDGRAAATDGAGRATVDVRDHSALGSGDGLGVMQETVSGSVRVRDETGVDGDEVMRAQLDVLRVCVGISRKGNGELVESRYGTVKFSHTR